ncbi:hypothetical protein FISHEDRAFT_46044 [Fistulina hepatica ATCC 64428]|uniref:HAD-like protein n=1 Tax=Fistulina hepatica ATCC 64428 TaxID=1128425 RepID=A0A0D7A8K9_9AGAR|nr:hypothetical protein FISHEDRAFT_46044 [Fistulina hepatica ATCC 64428]
MHTFSTEYTTDDTHRDHLAAAPPLLAHVSVGPVIAVDLDDVLSQTNEDLAKWHNETYDTNMDLSLFYYYYYWKNPYWGTPLQTLEKVTRYYAEERIFQTEPIPGARHGLSILRRMGCRLIVVTARSPEFEARSRVWLQQHFPDIFDNIVCTGQFRNAMSKDADVTAKLSKAEVCAELGARVLIDDSAENALQVVKAKHIQQPYVLLFGDYEWNRRVSFPGDNSESMTFEKRFEASGRKEFWKEETLEAHLPEDALLTRVGKWDDVVQWVKYHLRN